MRLCQNCIQKFGEKHVMPNNYFYIEPFVHADLIDNHILLYNTLNHKTSLYLFRSKESVGFAKRLLEDDVNRIALLSEFELVNSEIREFIEICREYYHGDLIESDYRPVIMPFAPKLNFDFDHLNDERTWQTMNLRNSFHEVFIYHGDSSTNITDSALSTSGIKQINAPITNLNMSQYESSDLVLRFFRNEAFPGLRKVHLYGNKISLKIIKNTCDFFKDCFVHYNAYISGIAKDIFDTHKLTNTENLKFILWVDFKTERKLLFDFFSMNEDSISRIVFKIIIRDVNDISDLEQILIPQGITYEVIPFIENSTSNALFEVIKSNKADVENQSLTHREIASRLYINHLSFGKLFILPNGDVHANLNMPHIGNIKSNKLIEILRNAHTIEHSSWYLTRAKVEPCKNCVYRYLCQPISSYELYFGIMNLCNYDPVKKIWHDNDKTE